MHMNINKEHINEYVRLTKTKRNLQTAIAISFMLAVLVIFASINRLFPSDASQILTSISIAFTCTLIIYYYLQTRPIELPRRLIDQTPLQELKSARTSLDETENLISIYENIQQQETAEIRKTKERIIATYSDLCYEWFSPRSMLRIDDSLLSTPIGITIIKNNIATTRTHILELIAQEQENQKSEHRDNENKRERTRLLGERAYIRLSEEIALLSKRSNIYISIGTIITFIAGYILYLAAQETYQNITATETIDLQLLLQPKILLGTTIKLSIVIFIEIFAFYFLKLYRDIMENIKYYQNEITNIDLKIAGLNAAESSDDCMKIAVEELLKTERNFIIKDKHTTIELERQKHENSSSKELIDTIFKAIKIRER